MTAKIPVTVLTGFLGSGKTTLLNRILSEEHGLRIAVIENEFGEIGIDQDLVINADEEVFEMNNGCICCTVRGDLIHILSDLVERKSKFDRVILGTTGMADPGPSAGCRYLPDERRAGHQGRKRAYVFQGMHILFGSKALGRRAAHQLYGVHWQRSGRRIHPKIPAKVPGLKLSIEEYPC